MAATYKVVSQTPVTAAVPGGQFQEAMEIVYETIPSGVTGRVRVPLSAYGPGHVDEVLTDAAATLEAVQKL